ncbi:MAG: hypothetical protein KTR31_40350 [Myxococcales bacterium]|nr:hypothetical protein [Myxococcales bacterium]
MAFPTPVGWQRTLLIALVVAYVVELVLFNVDVPIYALLPWHAPSQGFAFWQLVTRFVVQGNQVIGVVMSLLVLYLFLPSVETIISKENLGQAVLAGAAGGTLLPFLLDMSGMLSDAAPLLGWSPLLLVLFAIVGIARPDSDILLMFVLPVKARIFLWGSLAFALIFVLASQGSRPSFEMLGVWIGSVGWWHWLGPGRARRELIQQAAGIERELRRFEVLEGGRSQEGSNGPDDDWVH